MERRDALRLLAYSGATLTNIGAVGSFFQQAFASGTRVSDTYGVTILVDGWRADMFKKMLLDGELPNIKKHLVDRGSTVENFVGSFPSTTGPAHLPYINGVVPGHNNCPGLRWVDRNTQEIRDYCTIDNFFFNSDFPGENFTIYEMLRDQLTACIFDFASRGAKLALRPDIKTLWWAMTGNIKAWEMMDENAVRNFEQIYDKTEIPRYTFVWMPALDHLCHVYGVTSEQVRLRALGIDDQIRRITEKLQKARIYDNTVISLVADHGLRDTHTNTDPRETLQSYGLNVMEDLTETGTFTSLNRYNTARGVSGNGFAMLYFSKQKNIRGIITNDWSNPVQYDELRDFHVPGNGRIDLIKELRKEKSIKLVMAKKREDVYMVFSKNGEGMIEREFSNFRYSSKGSDPLGFDKISESKNLKNGKYHDKDIWFGATAKSNHPDALFQISQLFDSRRCGEIVLSSEPGYDFLIEGHKATHGGLEKAEIMVPCVIAGPGIKQGIIPTARSVDIYPTYLKSLGIPKFDGEVLNVFS